VNSIDLLIDLFAQNLSLSIGNRVPSIRENVWRAVFEARIGIKLKE